MLFPFQIQKYYPEHDQHEFRPQHHVLAQQLVHTARHRTQHRAQHTTTQPIHLRLALRIHEQHTESHSKLAKLYTQLANPQSELAILHPQLADLHPQLAEPGLQPDPAGDHHHHVPPERELPAQVSADHHLLQLQAARRLHAQTELRRFHYPVRDLLINCGIPPCLLSCFFIHFIYRL